MLECIDNLSFNSSINKDDEIFNLFKTKSPNINSIILSKIECHTKLFDFFNKHSNLDINAVSKSINNINNLFLNILIPNSINDNEDFEYYINVLSTIILTFHYILKIKAIIFKKVKEIQQGLIESILNSKFEEALKDKFIEYNSLCYSALKDPFQEETTFSTFLVNKPKVMNHFNSNGQKYFNKEEPTPKFFVFDKEPKIQFNKNKKIRCFSQEKIKINSINKNNINNEEEYDDNNDKDMNKFFENINKEFEDIGKIIKINFIIDEKRKYVFDKNEFILLKIIENELKEKYGLKIKEFIYNNKKLHIFKSLKENKLEDNCTVNISLE